ncbi:LacI family DNA-binding transcriptional regulator [Microbacterium sp. P03]|uniref:LacI family DNA-binding transcriptional regulator n=1 Tax=Microbacterium sp. P03 TaxID=3366946 RepID=UPI003744CFAD
MTRVTISDIAEAAGLSKGAVSYALNGRPGVSERTRTRVQRIAADLGWSPNLAARSLSTSTADAIGLVLTRPGTARGLNSFYLEFIAGTEQVIAQRGVALMLHVVATREDELSTYEKWWREGRVDGVLIVDLDIDDPRGPVVQTLGLPAVAVGSSDRGKAPAQHLPHVWTDDDAAMRDAVRYLARLGHRRFARVGGRSLRSYTAIRDAAFLDEVAAVGASAVPVLATDYSGEAGARATRDLLTRAQPPTAIIFDSDVLAVAGLGVARELGVDVPRELSILAWDDSALCEITHPPLSALRRDVAGFGAAAAHTLLEVIATGRGEDRAVAPAVLVPRASTGPSLG